MAKFLSRYASYGTTLKVGETEITARFNGGVLQTENKKLVDALKKHPDFGIDFFQVEEVAPKEGK